MKRIRRILVVTLLGAGCAVHADRAAVTPSQAVYVAPNLVATCASGSPDSFEYDPAPRAATTCLGVDDDEPEAALDDDASPAKRARAIAEFLSGAPADPPVDGPSVSTSIRRAASP